jgi:predicted MFS family arabinose efflux permease
VACGATVANLYYSQPLLHTLARSFETSSGVVATVVTVTQVGYAAGLLFLVPLGDLVRRRRLVVVMGSLAVVGLVGCGLAPSFALFEAAVLAVGCASVVAQILVPLAADLASEERRGQVVGTVMSGLLMGILLARTVSGLLASLAGWRFVYLVAAVVMAILVVVLRLVLPSTQPSSRLNYLALLRSTAAMVREEPLLRRRSLLGALCFACFSVLWTTISFLLSGPPYHYGIAVIGLFGLVGAAGALCATFAGRLADAGWTRRITLGFAVLILAAFILMVPGRNNLIALIGGILILDVGVQGVHITNQSIIYSLRADARSRINSAYMTTYFVGGAAGSAVAGVTYAAAGWIGVCGLGIVLAVAMVAAWGWDLLLPAAPARPK